MAAALALRRELEVQALWHEQVSSGSGSNRGGYKGRGLGRLCQQGIMSRKLFFVPMQVHASRVAALAFSAEGDALWSGCDAAAPRPGPDDASMEPPVALVSCKASAARPDMAPA